MLEGCACLALKAVVWQALVLSYQGVLQQGNQNFEFVPLTLDPEKVVNDCSTSQDLTLQII